MRETCPINSSREKKRGAFMVCLLCLSLLTNTVIRDSCGVVKCSDMLLI